MRASLREPDAALCVIVPRLGTMRSHVFSGRGFLTVRKGREEMPLLAPLFALALPAGSGVLFVEEKKICNFLNGFLRKTSVEVRWF
jgi:hypothetical protein